MIGSRVAQRGGEASRSGRREIYALVAFLGVNAAVAFLSGLATSGPVRTWYPNLAKPSWTPPPWVFGPAWTVLYAMIAVAAWRIWRRRGWGAPLAAYTGQLVLNAAWSFLFFGARSPLAGLLDILLLWGAIVLTLALFRRVDRMAVWLLAPYLLWVTFAAALNLSIWHLNP